MYLPILLTTLLIPLTFASSSPPQYIFSNPPLTFASTFSIPTKHESAILARRILKLSSIATLSTNFPTSEPSDRLFQLPSSSLPEEEISLGTRWGTPDDVAGLAFGLMDYYASCTPFPSDPTILAISIATTFRNARAGSNVTLSLRWHPPSDAPPSDDIYAYSPANMPRFSLVGYIEPIPEKEAKDAGIQECFLARHPDAEAWLPGNEIHQSWWARLVVRDVYWIGGFGDRAYIGWISEEEWKGVRDEEVEGVRLVGEKGYEGTLMYQSAEL